MKNFLIITLVLMILSGCSYFEANSQQNQNYQQYAPSRVDTLQTLLSARDKHIDSLYVVLDQNSFVIDSLKNALEISQSRVAVSEDFVIPDSIIFAGRKFDLTNERVYNKFETIFKQELKTAHKYIPRSGKYFAYFDSVFAHNDIPLDIKYLAIAESRLSPMAGSRVGAAGIWQFMPKTAIGFGLKVDSFVDERRGVVKSTHAAAKYILNSKRYLANRDCEDWLLIFAAYNAGNGSIARVIREQDNTNFFDLVMKVDETHNYVWRAAAIKMIMQNEEEIFGKKFERQSNLFDDLKEVKITLKGHYKIDDWAKAYNTSLGQTLDNNPWIKIYQRSRKKYSPINDVVLPPGEFSLLIPKECYPDNTQLASIEKQFLNKNAGFFTHHVVKSGDSLYKIAKKYKTTISKIKALNGLKSDIIRPGQKLRLYGTPESTTKTYVVKRGDSVGNIAKKVGTTSSKLIARNNLKTKKGVVMIYPGQKLIY